MLYHRGKRRIWTSPVAAWVAALFALVQVVAMAHHADHGADDLLAPGMVGASYLTDSVEVSEPAVASAAVSADHHAAKVSVQAGANAAEHPDLCLACLLSSAAQTILTHSPAPKAEPTLLAWRARRFVRSFRAASGTSITSSSRGPPAAPLATV